VSEVPTNLTTAKIFQELLEMPIQPPSRHHKDPFNTHPYPRPQKYGPVLCYKQQHPGPLQVQCLGTDPSHQHQHIHSQVMDFVDKYPHLDMCCY
jgi:hypothetical protein